MAERSEIRFEWDPRKAASNLRKHGFTFERGTRVLLDPLALSVVDEEHESGEERWATRRVHCWS